MKFLKSLLAMVKNFLTSKPFVEAAKEFLRVVAVAVLPVVGAGVEAGKIDWRLVLVVGVMAALKFIDKYLHQVGKLTDNESLVKGLTRF